MKSACLLLLVSCLVPPLAGAGTPLIRNGSFEQAQQGGEDQALDWYRWGDWINRECDWSPVRDGKCLLGYHHWRITKADSSGIWQDAVGIRRGRHYTFRIFANADHPGEGKSEAETIEVRLESTLDGRQVAVNSRTYEVADLATGEAWSPLTVSGTAPNNTLRVVVVINPSANSERDGAVKFDEATLERAPR